MIRFIAAIDSKRGVADEHGIPWLGKIPSDVHYYHKQVEGFTTLIGYGMYLELKKPLVNPINYVASKRDTKLRDGFILAEDAVEFLQKHTEDVWVLGGAALYASTIHLADELYLTRLDADFKCTKFFPEFEQEFSLTTQSDPITENGITYTFQVWKRN
jgi:dihydrofolate reductase